jgi:hypothetical protein
VLLLVIAPMLPVNACDDVASLDVLNPLGCFVERSNSTQAAAIAEALQVVERSYLKIRFRDEPRRDSEA